MDRIEVERVYGEDIPVDLILEADPDMRKVEGYMGRSCCYAGRMNGDTVGVFTLLPLGEREVELMNIAVLPEYQRKGIGSFLLSKAVETAAKEGFERMEVGTGTFGYQLKYYQRAGFRVDRIVRDFFIENYSEAVYEFGIQHRDMLVLTLDLKNKKEA